MPDRPTVQLVYSPSIGLFPAILSAIYYLRCSLNLSRKQRFHFGVTKSLKAKFCAAIMLREFDIRDFVVDSRTMDFRNYEFCLKTQVLSAATAADFFQIVKFVTQAKIFLCTKFASQIWEN